MTIFTKKKFIGSFLCMALFFGSSLLTLNSCNTDAEEPFWPDDDDTTIVEDPTDGDEEKPGDDNGDEEKPGDDNSGDEEKPGDDNNGDEEKPGDDNTGDDNTGDEEQPGEDNNGDDNGDNNGDNTGDEEKPGETPADGPDAVPSNYKYPLSYVVLPEGTPQQVKEYTGFTVNFNKNNHTPNYVCWELLKSETNGSTSTSRDYWVDKEVEGCLSTDYAYSTYKYERGHMCPAADQKWSSTAMKDAAVMTNMVPQLSSLNSGLWATLENKERDWAKRDGAIWIVSGPVYYDSDNLYVGAAKARVPSACFKAFLYYDESNPAAKPRAIAFVMQNGSNPGNLQDYAMSVDDLEKLLGYDLFYALPDDIENEIEATYSFSDWNK